MYIILKLQPYFFNFKETNFSTKYPYYGTIYTLVVAYYIYYSINFFIKKSIYTIIILLFNAVLKNSYEKHVTIYIVVSGLWYFLNDLIFTNEMLYYYLFTVDRRTYDLEQMKKFKRICLWDIISISLMIYNAYLYFVPSSYNELRIIQNIVDIANGFHIDCVSAIKSYIKHEFFTNSCHLFVLIIFKMFEFFTGESL